MADQPTLPLTAPECCRRCHGTGKVYYLAGRADVVGGKRVVCPECLGTGWIGGLPETREVTDE